MHIRTLYAAALLVAVALNAQGFCAEIVELKTDVCVVGGGSGGMAAALAAARAGVDVVLVERQKRLGGTSTNALVCSWQPGPGDSFAREIFGRLEKLPCGVAISGDHNADRSKGPIGLWLVVPGAKYEETLGRIGLTRPQWRAVVFNPDALAKTVAHMLDETGKCRTLLETSFTRAETRGERIVAIRAEAADGTTYRIRGRVFIDSTGGAHLCRAVGCETMLGPDLFDRFKEPSAPREKIASLNAISLCYRVNRSKNPRPAVKPDPAVKRFPRSAHVGSLPCGDLIINPLATVPGRALIDDGYEECMARCKRILRAHWYHFQKFPCLAGYEFDHFAPMLGIRESYRVVGEYVLTQQDLMAGLSKQSHPDIVAIADHSMDVHGSGGARVRGSVSEPYGIPYRCLIPKGRTNLLVACRGASFSHIAASSCRLSRTIISLGHAAGNAAAMAVKADCPVGDVDIASLRKGLGMPGRKQP